ncbi:DUF6893 family small protein [Streptomyces cinnamoneus]|nr:hypothetical protein [Streptomyces cinnamoneus]
MRNGIFIPAVVVRVAVGALALAAAAAVVFNAPDAVRYFKMETM